MSATETTKSVKLLLSNDELANAGFFHKDSNFYAINSFGNHEIEAHVEFDEGGGGIVQIQMDLSPIFISIVSKECTKDILGMDRLYVRVRLMHTLASRIAENAFLGGVPINYQTEVRGTDDDIFTETLFVMVPANTDDLKALVVATNDFITRAAALDDVFESMARDLAEQFSVTAKLLCSA